QVVMNPCAKMIALLLMCLTGCAGNESASVHSGSTQSSSSGAAMPVQVLSKATDFYVGADLSYVNEMQDCGADYRLNEKSLDPFLLFAEAKANLVRVRLWHTPTWTHYSNMQDVTKT